jgi:hypothetical protein
MGLERVLWLALALSLAACATWQAPERVDPEEFRQRATALEKDGVTVRALVLTRADGLRLLGEDIFALDIEPIWIEVVNDTKQPLTLLQSGTDPDYYSPLEVSWSLHGRLTGKINAAIDDHFQSVAFRRGPISPGETRQGVIFTNPHYQVKFLNIDILGARRFTPFSLFLPIPDEDGTVQEQRPWPYAPHEMTDFSEERAFSQALAAWFTAASADDDSLLDQPLSMVWVGRPLDLGAALVRRGYRGGELEQDQEQRLYGAPPDYVLRKSGQVGAPANWIRLWALPMTFQDRPVLVGQAGAPRGGRFAGDNGDNEPAIDKVRDMVVQDMLYSGGMAKLSIMRRPVALGPGYTTDGRIAVLFVAARPRGLADVLIGNWERVDWALEPAPYADR